MTPPLPLAEAQRRLLAGVAPLAPEQRTVLDAHGRYLAAPVIARRTQPAADLSAMDGYAMQAGTPGPWRVIGETAAGHPFTGDVGAGEAIRISTGALMPRGADAVLMQENARRTGDTLALNGEGEPSARHIRRAGFDFRIGDGVLAKGTRIGAAHVALALSAGQASLAVHRLPRLVAIDTGDELSPDPERCAEDQIPMSNGAMVAALARGYVEQVTMAGPVRDEVGALAATFARFADCDVIVTSGGASVGDHDVLRPALEAWGATIDFWRVAMKPGKPLVIARKGATLVLGLPGNPVSSYVTATMFLLPVLRKLAGATEYLPAPVTARTTRDLQAGSGGRLEFLRARIEGDRVTPLEERDSSALRSLAAANALIEWPADAPMAPAGTPVTVHRLENGGIA
ncbi:MAG: molybdopterin molybdotransferase MoeA [Croceibacterium sp.]